MNVTSKNQGKSGGARVITHEILLHIDQKDINSVYFISIYDKSEYDTVDIDTIKKYIKEVRNVVTQE